MAKKIFAFAALTLFLFACSSNNVTEDDSLGKYFDSASVRGCFALYDNGQGHFTVYNLKRFRDSAYTPASTFKIVNSLIGLQTGKITDENMVIRWDSVKRWNEDWNKDLTMAEAFRVSALPYYQEIARRIGRDTMQKWIDTLSYGNRNISGPIDSFWINNRLKITADEQLGLVKKLYFDQLPFYRRNMEIVRKVMLRESNSNYRLSYKTGWANNDQSNNLAWVLGWIEENNHPYFFVLNVETPNHQADIISIRMHILKGILARMGFFSGKK